ncbi:hypothetical protein VP01_15432g1, partial [Puccinia sorghi]
IQSLSHMSYQMCYSLYNIKTSPLTCQYKETDSSLVCRNELFLGNHFFSLNKIPWARKNRFQPLKSKKKKKNPDQPMKPLHYSDFSKLE